MDVRRLPPPPRTGKLEAPPGLEPGMEVLQTSALPLGDGAVRTATRAAREDSRSRSLGGQVQPFERGEALIDLAGGRWSGKRDSNPRLRPWQGRTLPLSYSRSPRTLRQRYHRERLRFKALSRPGLAPRGSDRLRTRPSRRRGTRGSGAWTSCGSDRLRTRPSRQETQRATGRRRSMAPPVTISDRRAGRTDRRGRSTAQHGRRRRPRSATGPAGAERVPNQRDVRRIAGAGLYGHDVEAARPRGPPRLRHVALGHRHDPPLLARRHRPERAAEAAGRSRLDLDEHEHVAIPRDDVDFATTGPEPARKNGVPAAAQLSTSEIFSLPSKAFLMRCRHDARARMQGAGHPRTTAKNPQPGAAGRRPRPTLVGAGVSRLAGIRNRERPGRRPGAISSSSACRTACPRARSRVRRARLECGPRRRNRAAAAPPAALRSTVRSRSRRPAERPLRGAGAR